MPDRSWLLVFSFILTALSALISYSIAYLKGLSDTTLEKDRESGDRRAEKLLHLAENEGKAEATLRTGLVLCCAGTFLTLTVALLPLLAGLPIGTKLGFGLCALLLTLLCGGLFAVLAVIVPTKLGDQCADTTEEYKSTGLVCFLHGLCTPFAALPRLISRGILRILGVDLQKTEGRVTEDEILDMVDMGEESGNIESGEKEMIENIFDFTDITAASVMTHRTAVTAIDVSSSDEEIYEIIRRTGYSRFPVYEESVDSIVGILNAKTYLLERASGSQKSLRSLLYDPYLVPETVHADRLLSDMKKNKIHIAVVLDEYGGTSGIVTMEDLLEEIVGNIYDETDDPAEESECQKLGDNLWRLAGSLNLQTLSDELGVVLDEEDCDTLGGLVFSRMTVIPEDGSTPVVDAGPLHIECEPLRERRVEWAKVSVIAPAEEKEDE